MKRYKNDENVSKTIANTLDINDEDVIGIGIVLLILATIFLIIIC